MSIKGKAFKHFVKLVIDAGTDLVEEISQKIDKAAEDMERKSNGSADKASEAPKSPEPSLRDFVIQTSDSGPEFKQFLDKLKVFDPKIAFGKAGPMGPLDVYPTKSSLTAAQINALCPPCAKCFEIAF